jgi:glycosyltransferase involved in cell wall biosynthesis
VVAHEQTGLLIPAGDAQALADAVARLAQDPALRTRWGQAGQQRQRTQFSAANQARQIASVYALVMGRTGR